MAPSTVMIAWTLDLTSPMPMKIEFAVTVDGDTLNGNVKLGSFGSAVLEGTCLITRRHDPARVNRSRSITPNRYPER
jgi:hypothetical protein